MALDFARFLQRDHAAPGEFAPGGADVSRPGDPQDRMQIPQSAGALLDVWFEIGLFVACMTLLLFGGPATARRLAEALRLPLGAIRDVVARLEMAGYARRSASSGGPLVELTPHAREWIDRID